MQGLYICQVSSQLIENKNDLLKLPPQLSFQSHMKTHNTTVVIRYNTIGGVHKYKSCYKQIVLYEMARFYLVLLDTIWPEMHGMRWYK